MLIHTHFDPVMLMIHICLFKAKFGDTGYVSPLEKHKNKPLKLQAETDSLTGGGSGE